MEAKVSIMLQDRFSGQKNIGLQLNQGSYLRDKWWKSDIKKRIIENK